MFRIHVAYVEPFSAFKVIGNESNIESYNNRCMSKNTKPVVDWTALYMQFDKIHALESLGYRWQQHYSLANLVEVRFPKCQIVIIDGNGMEDGKIRSEIKAEVRLCIAICLN